jgi:diguanylate cyclase (GGDEF)-like protein
VSATDIRLLLVEDSPNDAELAVALIEQAGLGVTWERVDSEEALRRALALSVPDLVLSDFSMAGFDGVSALRTVREAAPEVAFILFSGAVGDERAIQAMRDGASDYVLKDNPQRLGSAVRRALDQARERKAYEERLEHFANYDRLTHLPNRRLLQDRGEQAVAQAHRAGRVCALLIVDVDRFSLFNDSYGNDAGDKLLRALGERLAGTLREGDTLARFGEDAFAILVNGLDREEDAASLVRTVCQSMQSNFHIDQHDVRVSVSVAAATFPRDGETFEELARHAVIAKHRVKERGGNDYQFYAPRMNDAAQQRLALEIELNRAVARGEFELHYQPKVELGSGAIRGAEVLLRWNHPEGRCVPADEFIPVLEATGLIVELGDWVIVNVCRQIQAWQAQGLRPPPVAINLSARQFQHNNLERFVRTALELTGIDPGLLEFELTETVAMNDTHETMRAMETLRACGVRLSLDDFGTGYSSLAYLRRLPIDALKIDRVFIRELPASAEDAAITHAIINLAHTLQLKVIAEGVETAAQLAFLTTHGCDEIQGYVFSPAVPAAEMTAALRDDRRLTLPPNRPQAHPRAPLSKAPITRTQTLARRMLEVQESERRDIARELHDEIGQALTAVQIGLQRLRRRADSRQLQSDIDQCVSIAARALDQVRSLTLNLRPPHLDDLGLESATRWLLTELCEPAGLTAKLDSSNVPRKLAPDVEIACFRIIQEALTNIVRHAHAWSVAVELRLERDVLTLTIKDDGSGFDVDSARERAAAGTSMGLLGMQERADLVGGGLTIEPGSHTGTRITAWFPTSPDAGQAGE